jgi:hypothetical protein
MPDIILEGIGEISGLEYRGPGIWQFHLKFPEIDQIMYISVRQQGVLLERIFRYHHLEK